MPHTLLLASSQTAHITCLHTVPRAPITLQAKARVLAAAHRPHLIHHPSIWTLQLSPTLLPLLQPRACCVLLGQSKLPQGLCTGCLICLGCFSLSYATRSPSHFSHDPLLKLIPSHRPVPSCVFVISIRHSVSWLPLLLLGCARHESRGFSVCACVFSPAAPLRSRSMSDIEQILNTYLLNK